MQSERISDSTNRPVTITRTGRFWDSRYGEFEISRAHLDEMVRNFDLGAYGQQIFVDLNHDPALGAAGTIRRLWRDGDRLMASVEWTPFGRIAIEEKGFRYMSADYDEKFIDNETRQPWGCVLKGAALTLRPVVKRLDPVQLSDAQRVHAAIAGTGCAATLASELTDRYLQLAEVLPEDVRPELAVRLVWLAETAPKPRTVEVDLSRILAMMREDARDKRIALENVYQQRKSAIGAWITESGRAFASVNPDQLRRHAEKRLTVEISDADYDDLCRDLEDARMSQIQLAAREKERRWRRGTY